MNCEDLSSNPGWAGVADPTAADEPALEGKLDFDSVVTVVVDVIAAKRTAARAYCRPLRFHHAG